MDIQNIPALHNFISKMNMGGDICFTPATGREIRRYAERKKKKLQKKGVINFKNYRFIEYY